ncbi:hypothetical protein [Streptomyces sp. bgisy022]|uniref:hypothetical protein n=1 Tax=Streptomyces sp. bgisy022 TaxID=3413769 RepID=UPI003D74814B
MEQQRIGSSSQPLEGAGFDPAFIPGLTAPVSGREEDTRPGKDRPGEPEEANGTVNSGSSSPEARDAVPGTEAGEPDGAEEDADAVPDGPVFEASDRRATIVADHRGVRLRLDDQECEFRWDEIGAVETATARFGKRYTVTVHTPDRRWYPIEIEAPSRRRFAEWDTELDAVLDAYFDDGEEPDGDGGRDGDAETDATAKTDSGAEAKTDADPDAETDTGVDASESSDETGAGESDGSKGSTVAEKAKGSAGSKEPVKPNTSKK